MKAGVKGGFALLLEIECADAKVAGALDAVLLPDNRYFPKDQSFKASKSGRVLRFEVGSPRLRPAIGTATSILSDSQLFGELWGRV